MTAPDATADRRAGFVSRGGEKLQAALRRFGIPVTGRRALDAGASTGGFTDCLLAAGAREIVAVDVGYGILAWSLRNDARVRVLERTNARSIDAAMVGGPVDVVVADLAFISLRTVGPALLDVAAPGADLVLLVKPQFEAGRSHVERGGVVRDPDVWGESMRTVAAWYRSRGCALRGACPSPLVGPAGNREFFLHLAAPPAAGDCGDDVIARAVQEAP